MHTHPPSNDRGNQPSPGASRAHRSVPTTGRTIHWAAHYDTFVRVMTLGQDHALRRATVETAALARGQVVLDVGCGTGTLTRLARERVGPTGQVYGIDASAEMIEVARRKASQRQVDVDFRVAAIEALPFSNDAFDMVLSSLMMHHLPDDLKRSGLAEIHRVLKPGGTVTILDFKRPDRALSRLLMTALHHGSMGAGVQELTGLMAAVGFSSIEERAGPWPILGYAHGRK